MQRSTSVRDVVRLVVFDATGSILLLRYSEGLSGEPEDYWVTPGGAIEVGETAIDAARRELLEETGLRASIGRELWTCEFVLPASHRVRRQRERFFLASVEAEGPTTLNSSPESIRDQRWWTLAELLASRERMYPADLGERVRACFPGAG